MPADIIDQAQELTERSLEQGLARMRPLSIPFSGTCLHCGEPVEQVRFCDSFCRNDYEQAQRRRKINGMI